MNLLEAIHDRNLGFSEMFQFMQVASISDVAKMEKYLADEKFEKAWSLLKRVTGVKLKGKAAYGRKRSGLSKKLGSIVGR